MRTGAAVLDQKIGLAFDRKRTYLSDIGGVVQDTGGNGLIELKGLVDKLDRSNQHIVKGSRFVAQIKQPQKTRGFSPQYCSTTEIVRISTSGLQRPIPI